MDENNDEKDDEKLKSANQLNEGKTTKREKATKSKRQQKGNKERKGQTGNKKAITREK